jgi:hypothetical protein
MRRSPIVPATTTSGGSGVPVQRRLTEGQRILDAGEFTVDGFRVQHRDTESFAFSFESQVRRHLLPDRLAALGVPDGPVRKDLAEGRSVVLPDGRTVDSEDVLGPPEGRKKLVVVGDTETTDGLAEHARDADLLVIEATFLERDAAIRACEAPLRCERPAARCVRTWRSSIRCWRSASLPCRSHACARSSRERISQSAAPQERDPECRAGLDGGAETEVPVHAPPCERQFPAWCSSI